MDRFEFYDWRLRLKLTQQQCADLLGFKNRSSISRIEKGYSKVNIRLANLCHLIEEKAKSV